MKRRLQNRVYELLGRLRGRCLHNPYTGVPGTGGGYADWRCWLKRGHAGLHRSNNYVWTVDGKTSYMPENHHTMSAIPLYKLHMVKTRAQQRASDRWHGEQVAEWRNR